MKYVTEGYEPKIALQYFEDLAAIPRGSRNEEAAAKFVEEKAKSFGYYVRRDESNNVVVKIPATPGYENVEPICLQAHLDMVNEKNADSTHDFTKDGLDLYIDSDWLKARGTTLGCDDGYGCAFMLALMDEEGKTFVHPELECIFTTGEEIGFVGAMPMDCSDIRARRMIGMDGGPEGVTCATSAGAMEVKMYVTPDYEAAKGEGVSIFVSGLIGGHSAGCITFERANSNKVMGRILHNVRKVCDFRIANIVGGLMFNAIPRENRCEIVITDGNKEKAIEKINRVVAEIKAEYRASDPDITVEISDCSPEKMMSARATKAVTEIMYNVPNGVRMMNVEVPGLPVTSTNMGIVKEVDGRIMVDTMLRSSSRTCNDDYVDNICSVATLAGAEECYVGYWMPAWPYDAKSYMRDIYLDLYKSKTGKEANVNYVHGGLELGVFSEKMPGMQIVTIGVDAFDAHTVTERMSLSSFKRVFEFLKEYITEVTKRG